MADFYVGATGFTKLHETNYTKYIVKRLGFESENMDHRPMMGFLVSDKTLDGKPTDNKRYPPVESLHTLLHALDDGSVFTTIHYNTHDAGTLRDQIDRLLNYRDPKTGESDLCWLCDSIQFNVAWPSGEVLEKIYNDWDFEIILQLSRKAMESMHMDPIGIAKRLHDEYEVVYHVLIDPSGGTGRGIDIDAAVQIKKAIEEYDAHPSVGFAGGINPDNVYSVIRNIYDKTGNEFFSIDAESGLRRKTGEGYGNDEMEMSKVQKYFTDAKEALSSIKLLEAAKSK